ncbi:hypothetical protein H310_02447 [Aphanomyces invadans]|uniref:Peptidase S9 prolyl oligopeptidase catalytic domain-containing protein n=1 Tax=Aphanomyces invadans TaxID=157072 RepID=A0A024UR38_9STRA|nr:hypothetical protein H310_02447 [Aphanomyces invadans]ETW08083.1 hypothetical protein H310_02447 [Aphanomyces invadans]|eukprot:XP_008864176.1 hypothetical protein H310_02447 [Aphanomyces invadans]
MEPGRWTGSAADYARAASLPQLLQGKVLNEQVEPKWSSDNTRLWYLRQTGWDGANEVCVVDIHTGKALVDNQRLKESLGSALAPTFPGVEPGRIRFTSVGLICHALNVVRVQVAVIPPDASATESTVPKVLRSWFRVDLDTYTVTEEDPEAAGENDPGGVVSAARMITQHDGNETTVQFVNACSYPLHAYWVDGNGKETMYFDVAPGGSVDQHTYGGHVWHLKHATTKLSVAWHRAIDLPQRVRILGVDSVERMPFTPKSPPVDAASPGHNQAEGQGDTSAFNVVHNGVQLTFDGTATAYYDRIALSPTGDYIACFKVIEPPESAKYTLTLVEHCPKPGRKHPAAQTHAYPKPGDPLPTLEPYVIHIATGRLVAVDTALCKTPYDITNLTWHPSGQWFSFLYNPRGHRFLRLVGVHIDGASRVLLEETAPTSFVLHPKHFMQHLHDTHELLWTSEQLDTRHLYMYYIPINFDDIVAPLVGFALTQGPFVVRKVVDVDIAHRTVTLAVCGLYPGEDPYHIHVVRVHLDTTQLVRLTSADGCHRPLEYSPDMSVYLDRYSRVDMAPVVELRRTEDGSLICVLEQGDVSPLEAVDWHPPTRLAFPGRDGTSLIYGIVVFPLGYDFKTPLRVVENIYAGPHGAHVPKSFGLHLDMQKLAELGFAVVQMDGMGTAHRSKSFHDVCYQNVIDAGFPDRKRWIQALATTFPNLDLSKGVGIYGGSAGGQNAVSGLLTHGDLYTVAVADCGCHDNRVDKLWWNELWMGYPFDATVYAAISHDPPHCNRFKIRQHANYGDAIAQL